MPVKLYESQLKAVHNMKNGCILCGDVGSGKSLTAISYYYLQNGGEEDFLTGGNYCPMDDNSIKDLYIITTARKRDLFEWDAEIANFLLSTNDKTNLYSNKVVIDSWNNIQKYSDVKNAFFIFDEQRVVGYGAWSKTFIKIAKNNNWILLSATPGDTWLDYAPVFIANGFYKNITEYKREHIVYNNYGNFPSVDRYLNTRRLIRLRDSILIDLEADRHTICHHEDVYVSYNISKYKDTLRKRWNPYKDLPIINASELCQILRRIVNTDDSRIVALMEILEKTPKAIIFYNYDYELELLKGLYYGDEVAVAEWNGHKHQPIPDTDKWVYLVQYTAACEGWNCIKTDTIIFFSQNYSYKVMHQASGRINRLNTPYVDLYYYHLKSRSGIDLAISRALTSKKKFNESRFVNKRVPFTQQLNCVPKAA